MRKNQKGITLVALVITIIVLLILAGVTIASLAGENGLLTRSSKAVNANTTGTKEEQVVLSFNVAMGAFYDAKYVDNTVGTMSPVSFIVKELEKDKEFTEVADIYDGEGTEAKLVTPTDSSSQYNDSLDSVFIRLKGVVNRDKNEVELTGKDAYIQIELKKDGNSATLVTWSEKTEPSA